MNTTCFTCLSTENPLTPVKDVYWEILKALLSQQIDVDYICSAVTELCLCGKCDLLLHDVSVFRDKAVNSVHQQIELWNQNVDTVSCNDGTDMAQVELKTEIVDEESEGVMDSVVDTYKPEDDVTSNIKLEIKEESDWAHVEQLCESIENHDDLESLADQADNSELSDTSNVNQYCSKTKKNDDNTTQSKRKRKPQINSQIEIEDHRQMLEEDLNVRLECCISQDSESESEYLADIKQKLLVELEMADFDQPGVGLNNWLKSEPVQPDDISEPTEYYDDDYEPTFMQKKTRSTKNGRVSKPKKNGLRSIDKSMNKVENDYQMTVVSKKLLDEYRSEQLAASMFVDAKYKCRHCILTFTTPRDKLEHKNLHEMKGKYQNDCGICHQYVTNKDLIKHMNSHYTFAVCCKCKYMAKDTKERHICKPDKEKFKQLRNINYLRGELR